MVLGNTDGLRGHATLRRADRGASDDRKIPTRKSGGGLLANDERPSPISRRAHDVSGVGLAFATELKRALELLPCSSVIPRCQCFRHLRDCWIPVGFVG